jgi:two-component system, NtrC family, response regulator HydG
MTHVLVVDDDPGILESARLALEKVGHRVLAAASVAEARELLANHSVDVVVSDIYMPGEDGLDLLESIGSKRNAPVVILMTARGTIETATIAHRIGAFDYLAKPFPISALLDCVRAATTTSDVVEERIEPGPASMIVGAHPSMVGVYNAVSRIASLDVPVLIFGETGTGKELVARAIHELGARADAPFVAINCGAIPDTLLENELFGSVRGAYTDSRHDRRGSLARADGGTVFLDEIGDISPAFQVKLLRFLQDGLVTPLGSDKSHKVDVRVVAATHRDLRALVLDGSFREDLFFRVSGYEIRIPPLRERATDIPLLVEHFRRHLAKEMNRDRIAGPTHEVLGVLTTASWPGNVRQLEQAVRRIVIDSGALTDARAAERVVCEMSIASESPREAPFANGRSESPDQLTTLDEAERIHIETVLRATAGNQTQAAFILGIERKTLARKLKRYGITPAGIGVSP